MKTELKPWIVVFSAALFFFYEFIQMNMISSLAPYLMRDFSIDATKLGNLSATYFYATILFLLPAGQILDRISTRKVVLTALLVCILGTYCFSQAKMYSLAELSRLLTGIGSAFCFLSCIRLASRWFPNEKLALVSGLVVMMAMLGGTLAQTPLTLLINYLGSWRQAIMIDAVMGLVFWIIIFFVVRDYPKEKAKACDDDQKALEAYGYWRAMQTSYFKLKNWLCGLYTCFMNLPIYLIGGGGFGSLYLEQVKHLSTLQASYPPMMIFFGTVLGSPLAGWVSDVMRLRKLPMQIGAVISITLMFILINISASLFVYAVLFFLLGLVSSTQIISYPVVAESNPRIITATSVSVVSFTTLAGGAVFQPLFGFIMDKIGDVKIIHHIHVYTPKDYHVAMLIMPITMIVALAATFLIRETHCKSID